MEKKKEERLAKEMKELSKIPTNKRCADCTARSPPYVNLTHKTFVCTDCSGIHREFSHRIKSISLSTFSADEVKAMKEGGNEAVNKVYLARWDPREHPEPDQGSEQKSRDWIRAKYIDKRWHVDSTYVPARRGSREHAAEPAGRRPGDAAPALSRRNSGGQSGGSSRALGGGRSDNIPQSQPISAVLPDVKQVEVKRQETKKPPGVDLLDLVFAPGSPEPPPQPQAPPPQAAFGNADPFAAAPGGWGGFPPGPQGYPQQPPPQQQAGFPPQMAPPQQQQPGFPPQGFAGFPPPGGPVPPQANGGFGTDPFAQPVFPPQQQQPGFPPQQQQPGFNPGFAPPPHQPGFPPQQPQGPGFPPQQQQGGPGFAQGPFGAMPPQQQGGPFPGAGGWPPQQQQQMMPQPPGAFGQPPQGQFAGGPPPQQQPGGFGGFPGPQPQPPRPATVSIDDAFSELSVSGPPPPPPEPFRAGEQVLYTDSQGRNFPAEVVKVHLDDHPPYYTIRVMGGGPERQTDYHHLKRRPAPPPPQPQPGGPPPPGPQAQQPRPPAPPADPFSNLGQAAWNGVAMPGTPNTSAPRIDPFGGPPPTAPGGPVPPPSQSDNPFAQPQPWDAKPGAGAPPPPNPFAAPSNPYAAPQAPPAGPPANNPFFTPAPQVAQPPASGNPFDLF